MHCTGNQAHEEGGAWFPPYTGTDCFFAGGHFPCEASFTLAQQPIPLALNEPFADAFGSFGFSYSLTLIFDILVIF